MPGENTGLDIDVVTSNSFIIVHTNITPFTMPPNEEWHVLLLLLNQLPHAYH